MTERKNPIKDKWREWKIYLTVSSESVEEIQVKNSFEYVQ